MAQPDHHRDKDTQQALCTAFAKAHCTELPAAFSSTVPNYEKTSTTS